jgi:hypothetical protein
MAMTLPASHAGGPECDCIQSITAMKIKIHHTMSMVTTLSVRRNAHMCFQTTAQATGVRSKNDHRSTTT